MNNLRSLGTVRILDCLNNPPRVGAGRHKNLLERVREGRDDKGQPFGKEELTAKTLTVFIAGTDTLSSTFAALMYDVIRIPSVLRKLRAALNSALLVDNKGPWYDKVRNLPYL
jgi:benzoate 4-monooxygenase